MNDKIILLIIMIIIIEKLNLIDTMISSKELSSTAKIHIVRTDKTVNELRSKDCNIYNVFLEALKSYGSPFNKICYVAGLILDSHYDKETDTVLGHTSLGGGSGHIGLGVFGSQQIHTWPTCLEDVVPCLTDNTSNDPIRCGSKFEGCKYKTIIRILFLFVLILKYYNLKF